MRTMRIESDADRMKESTSKKEMVLLIRVLRGRTSELISH